MIPITPPHLPRVFGVWMATAIVVGTVIGTGVFKKGYNVAKNVPEFGLAVSVWVVGGILAMLGSLVLAEIALRNPRSGGNFVFLKAAYGPLWGFLWGWVDFWIIRTASIAVLATMFTESLHDFARELERTDAEIVGFWPRQFITVGVIAVLALVNARGTRLGGTVQVALTVLKVGSIVGIALLPFLVLSASAPISGRPNTAFMRPFWPTDWNQVNWGNYAAAIVAVLWAYHGWMNGGSAVEEVQRPSRNIPLSLLGGVLLLIALYVSANVAYYSAIPREEMATMKDSPVATQFLLRLLGPLGAALGSCIIMVSVLGSTNGNILVGPRLLMAMGQDGLAPERLSRIHRKYRTPVVAIFAMAAWSCMLVLLVAYLLKNYEWLFHTGKVDALGRPEVKSPFDVLTDFAVFGSVTFETMVVASLFVFRWRDRGLELPYRCPGYPFVPALYVAFMAWILWNMLVNPEHRTETLIGFGFIAAGVMVYYTAIRGMRFV